LKSLQKTPLVTILFRLQQKGYNNGISANVNSTANKFSYNGIEQEEALGLNLFEMDLRQYDPAIARWTGIDPVTHYDYSTYNAFDNNPVFWADPSGANSTAEWLQENGLTQDDLITVYRADNNQQSGPDDIIRIDTQSKRYEVLETDDETNVVYIDDVLIDDNAEKGEYSAELFEKFGYSIWRPYAVGFEITDAGLLTVTGELAFKWIFSALGKLFSKSGGTIDNVVTESVKLSDEALEALKTERSQLKEVLEKLHTQLQNGKDQMVREISRGNTPNPHGLAKEVNELIPNQIKSIQERLSEISDLLKK